VHKHARVSDAHVHGDAARMHQQLLCCSVGMVFTGCDLHTAAMGSHASAAGLLLLLPHRDAAAATHTCVHGLPGGQCAHCLAAWHEGLWSACGPGAAPILHTTRKAPTESSAAAAVQMHPRATRRAQPSAIALLSPQHYLTALHDADQAGPWPCCTCRIQRWRLCGEMLARSSVARAHCQFKRKVFTLP
jgi:hypothetical protein